MAQLLLRTNAALQDCERHLLASGAHGTEIESYLTQYLLVVMCAEVQQAIYEIAETRAALAKDPSLFTYVAASSRKVLRSVGKKEISKFIEMFGTECKSKLDNTIGDAEITKYSNAVGSRHDVAHSQGSRISFRELKDAVVIAERLLKAAALSVTPGQPTSG